MGKAWILLEARSFQGIAVAVVGCNDDRDSGLCGRADLGSCKFVVGSTIPSFESFLLFELEAAFVKLVVCEDCLFQFLGFYP